MSSTGGAASSSTGGSTGSGSVGDDDPGGGGGAPGSSNAAGDGGSGGSSEPADGGMSAMPEDAGASMPGHGNPDGCLVAARLDTCCTEAVAATQSEVDAAECLVAWAERAGDSALSTRCLARSPVSCAVVSCAEPRPTSRLVAKGGSGQCVFVDDCETVADCVLASDVRACCDCGHALPRDLVEADPCLVGPGEDPPAAGACGPTCLVLCGACAPPGPPRCEVAPSTTVRSCQ